MADLTWEIIGERLRKARMRLGLTQEDVANATGMSRPTVSQIESGKRPVSSLELMRFARIYHVPVHLLLQQADQEEAVEEVLFRLVDTTASELRPAVRAVLLDFVDECRTYAELERMVLGLTSDLPFRYSPERLGASAIAQGERAAAEERKRMGLGDDPVTNLPELLELQGVKVIATETSEAPDLAGAAIYRREFGPAVFVNLAGADLAPGRLNFTAAHEYAHLLFERDIDTFDYDNYLSDPKPFERRANAFAATFLMPEQGILRELDSVGWRRGEALGHTVALYLSARFGVSYRAMLWRLVNIGLLSDADRARLYDIPVHASLEVLGYKPDLEKHLSTWLVASTRWRFRMLVWEAYRRGLISAGRASSLLDMERSEFERVAMLGVPGDSPRAEK